MKLSTIAITTVIVMWTVDGNLDYSSDDQTMLDLKETFLADRAVQIMDGSFKDCNIIAIGGEEEVERITSSGHILTAIFLKKLHTLTRHSLFFVKRDSFDRMEKAVIARGYVLLYYEDFLLPDQSASRHLDMWRITRVVRPISGLTKWLVVLGDRDHFSYVASKMIGNLALQTVYLVPSTSSSLGVEELAFKPKFLSGKHCLREFLGEVVHVNASDHYLSNSFPKTLNGCHLTVGVKEAPPYIYTTGADKIGGPTIWTGLEEVILSTVANSLNFEVRYLKQDARVEFSIYKGLSDIVMSGSSFSLSFTFGIQGSHPYHFDRHMFFVPAGGRLPPWMSLVLEFELNTWILVLVVCVLAACIMEMRFLVAWAPILETSASSTLPRLRWFFLLYLLHCLFINTSYKSSLVSKLLYPGYYPPIQNVRELFAITNLTVCHDGDISHIMALNVLLNQYRRPDVDTVIRSPETCLKTTAEGQWNHSSSASENVYTYTAPSRMVGGKDPVVPLPEDGVIHTEIVRMIFSPKFPLLAYFNAILSHLCEGGLVSKWWSDIVRKRTERAHQEEDQLLTLLHLKPAFLVLLVGYSLSLLSFAAEILTDRYFKKLKHWYFQRKAVTILTDEIKYMP